MKPRQVRSVFHSVTALPQTGFHTIPRHDGAESLHGPQRIDRNGSRVCPEGSNCKHLLRPPAPRTPVPEGRNVGITGQCHRRKCSRRSQGHPPTKALLSNYPTDVDRSACIGDYAGRMCHNYAKNSVTFACALLYAEASGGDPTVLDVG